MLMKLQKKQLGLSLIELMVAITVGSLLVIGAVYLLVSHKRTYSQAERMMRINENGRYAIAVISEELRHVDYWGTALATDVQSSGALRAVTNDCSGPAAGHNVANPLWGTQTTSASAIGCISDAIPGTQVLVVKHVAQNPTPSNALASDSTYVLSNAVKAVLFNDVVQPPTNNPGGDIPKGNYWEYKSTVYYIRNNDDLIPSLYRLRLRNGQWSEPQEVAVGIEQIHFEYGVDENSDGSVDYYSGYASADWPKVTAVRIYLLVRSEAPDAGYSDQRTYTLGNGPVVAAPGDSFQRTVFNTSIGLRNRLLTIRGGLS